jgi:hypothetical protein
MSAFQLFSSSDEIFLCLIAGKRSGVSNSFCKNISFRSAWQEMMIADGFDKKSPEEIFLQGLLF